MLLGTCFHQGVYIGVSEFAEPTSILLRASFHSTNTCKSFTTFHELLHTVEPITMARYSARTIITADLKCSKVWLGGAGLFCAFLSLPRLVKTRYITLYHTPEHRSSFVRHRNLLLLTGLQ